MIIFDRKITLIRRITQVFFFILLFYGGYLLALQHIKITWWAVEQNPKNVIQLDYNNPTHTQPFQTVTPIRSCRFAGTTGTFRGCLMWFTSENLTWLPSFKKVLPHIIVVLLLSAVFSRFFCGWACPIGFLSEMLYEMRKALGFFRVKFPKALRAGLKIFGITLMSLLLSASLVIASPAVPWNIKKPLYLATCQMCPSKIITPLLTGFPVILNLKFESASTALLVTLFSLLVIFLLLYLLGVIFKRSWCKICPGGVILSFFNRGSLITKEKDNLKCTKCGICADCCPMETTNVYDERVKTDVSHSQCVHCYRCVDLCPEKDCLKIKFAGKEIFKS